MLPFAAQMPAHKNEACVCVLGGGGGAEGVAFRFTDRCVQTATSQAAGGAEDL